MTKSYQYGPGGVRLSQTTHKTDGSKTDGFYGYNPHTDVETVTDSAGNTRSTYAYTAYGTNDTTGFTGIDKPDPAQPDKPADNVYRYNAKRWDPASGAYDMGFRDYSPGLNRFLTRDSYNGALADLNLGTDPYTGNRYALGGGNPITGVELDGHLTGAACGPDGVACGMTDMGSSTGYTPVATATAPAAAGPAYPAGEVPEEIAQASGPARQDWIYHRLQDLHAGIHDQDGLDRYNQLKTAYCTEFTDPWCQGPTRRAAAEAGAELAMIAIPWTRLLKGLRIFGRSTTAAKSVDDILPTPQVGSTKLQNLVNNLYKGTTNPNRVGNGTTMDAIRNEIATGVPTGGRMHTIKGQETLNGLNNWLLRNKDADYYDRLVAQSLADELSVLLRGAP